MLSTRMFLKRTADLGTLPFPVGVREDIIPNKDLQATITEAIASSNLSEPMDQKDAITYLDEL